MAREVAFPLAEIHALGLMSLTLAGSGDLDQAVQLARLAAQVTGGGPGLLARGGSSVVAWALMEAGDLAGAEAAFGAALARCREAGDQWNLIGVLSSLPILDL